MRFKINELFHKNLIFLIIFIIVIIIEACNFKATL